MLSYILLFFFGTYSLLFSTNNSFSSLELLEDTLDIYNKKIELMQESLANKRKELESKIILLINDNTLLKSTNRDANEKIDLLNIKINDLLNNKNIENLITENNKKIKLMIENPIENTIQSIKFKKNTIAEYLSLLESFEENIKNIIENRDNLDKAISIINELKNKRIEFQKNILEIELSLNKLQQEVKEYDIFFRILEKKFYFLSTEKKKKDQAIIDFESYKKIIDNEKKFCKKEEADINEKIISAKKKCASFSVKTKEVKAQIEEIKNIINAEEKRESLIIRKKNRLSSELNKLKIKKEYILVNKISCLKSLEIIEEESTWYIKDFYRYIEEEWKSIDNLITLLQSS